ncbi:Chloroplast envelope membrane protein [Tetrabaena socialis]|uniref:Chloroplast envelope membrane protein n=1 Tax=Tetrabaena socialis TaxID=47790 RepID=A0A2J7ZI42_9CHLO|nr:Chloroplast envelope membrane protein [Tetrabaena socialis]|eukprot:PNG99927.1 Chloroplast envelope membrane protein [Tetrabaena socialis]
MWGKRLVLLDWDAVREGLDPDQERSEQMITGEALVNKEESQLAVRYVARLIGIPLVTGFILSRALADPILNFSLRNNPDAFELSEMQKVEGAQTVHVEETRLRLDMAIGHAPPMTELQMFEHLAEFAAEVQEEERHHNETILLNVVSDSASLLTLAGLLSQATRGRDAMLNTMQRLFYGLSDIAKAVGIILVADTLLGYHSEEGWHGLIELVCGHYGVEPSEGGVVVFVGVVPVVIDVFFKYWIFIGLNRISPGAVVTIKQVDRH